MGQRIIIVLLAVMIFFFSCSKEQKDYKIPDDQKLQIWPAGCTIDFSVPYGYNSSNGSYSLAPGVIVAEQGAVSSAESFFFVPKRINSTDLPSGVSINAGQNGIVVFMSSAEHLNKELLVKFPFSNLSYFNNAKTKAYRVKVDNINAILSDIRDTAKWESMPIIRIDTLNKQVHFKSDKFASYIYCVARKP